MTTADRAEVEDYAQQSLQFLERAREYVAAGDLHQASEKAWGAAAHMAKAVAAAQGWEYDKHRDFSHVLNNAWQLTGNDQIRSLRATANDLHGNYYRRRRFLNAEAIAADIESVAELVELLAPLTK
ncbi:MAG: HEPN domain-containing protein [Chloroflexi bacterium]|nr:HEPN domain-containing protein [Chloroflexota bacterium]MYC01859.1 HEPN domain-containing protein [Chloroflexota bacterium]